MPHHVIRISVADWEIGCCAPPPVIGEESSWWLTFIPELEPGENHLWTVGHDDAGAPRLDGHGVRSRWWSASAEAPPVGTHTLRGLLSGSVHGPVPDDLPRAVGRVRRVRLVSREYTWSDGPRSMLTPVPGTSVLTDLSAAPKHYAFSPGPGRQEDGVLIDLAVPY